MASGKASPKRKMTLQEYRQMKADDPYKPVVIKPAPKKGKK